MRAEHVAEIASRPVKCDRDYRLIITRKSLDVESAGEKLWDEYGYFFHLTNDAETPAVKLVLLANGRCDQENLIERKRPANRIFNRDGGMVTMPA